MVTGDIVFKLLAFTWVIEWLATFILRLAVFSVTIAIVIYSNTVLASFLCLSYYVLCNFIIWAYWCDNE